jgi:hypothetical protein
MGLCFTVGITDNAFEQPFSLEVKQELKKQLGYSEPLESPFGDDGFGSEEVAWSGWNKLQERASSILGEERVPHLLSIDAWQGVYLPVLIDPTVINIMNDSTPLQCASLPLLSIELEEFAKALSLPIQEEELQELWDKYMDEEEEDEDMDIQTYIQLMLSTKVAISYNLPLWVVK